MNGTQNCPRWRGGSHLYYVSQLLAGDHGDWEPFQALAKGSSPVTWVGFHCVCSSFGPGSQWTPWEGSVLAPGIVQDHTSLYPVWEGPQYSGGQRNHGRLPGGGAMLWRC